MKQRIINIIVIFVLLITLVVGAKLTQEFRKDVEFYDDVKSYIKHFRI